MSGYWNPLATAYFNAPFYFDDKLAQYQGQFLGPPRTYGVTLRVNFKADCIVAGSGCPVGATDDIPALLKKIIVLE